MGRLVRRAVQAIQWRWFDPMCPYKLRVCWRMTDSAGARR